MSARKKPSPYPKRILALDLETTGLVSAYDYIVQIGAAVMEKGQVVDVFQTRVKPNAEKLKLTLGALSAQVGDLLAPDAGERIQTWLAQTLDAPEAKEAAGALAAWLRTTGGYELPVVAHNAAFDHGFYGQFAYQQKRALQPSLSPIWICTMEMAKAKLPGGASYSLDACLLALGIPPRPAAHDALQDAILAGRVYHEILKLPCNSEAFDG